MSSSKLLIKPESGERVDRLAVLIDADNAQAAVIEALLSEIAKYGEATVKRIYGDFTSPSSASWKKVLAQYAIKPVQQFAYVTGKNATDSAMIIDAMDLLYTRRFDGFCLVSSDSDYTGLAIRLREEGLSVFGFGEEKTPVAFRKSCHKFIFTEILRPGYTAKDADATPLPPQASTSSEATEKAKRFPRKVVLTALANASDESGWAHLGAFGSILNKLIPDFDSRLYGYKKLSDLVRAKKDIFEIDERETAGSTQKKLYLRAVK